MKAIAIYVEGGGDTADQKAELRAGFDQLLNAQKQAARAKRLGWKLVPSGDRRNTYEAFIHALSHADGESLLVLVVDSEVALAPETKNADAANAQARVRHLTERPDDKWDLSPVNPKNIHLMVHCMEAWIASDPEALARYYGQKFHEKSLSKRLNLEEERKADLYDKLKKATEKTQKGAYAKIKHASKLLAAISPDEVTKRCPRFKTFTSWLTEVIAAA